MTHQYEKYNTNPKLFASLYAFFLSCIYCPESMEEAMSTSKGHPRTQSPAHYFDISALFINK